MTVHHNRLQNKASKSSPKLTVNNITIKTLNRNNVDIDTWRSALRSADRGKRSALYNLYDDLLLDNVLSDAVDKRITAITNAEITFTRGDKSVPQIDDLMDTPEFELVIEEILRAKFWGISLLEFEFSEQGITPHVVPRKHIRADVGEIALEEGDERGVPYRDSDFFLEIDTRGLGLLLKAAPYVIYKRNNVGDWAQYVEIFGRPTRTIFYEAYDEAMRVEIAKSLAAAGGGVDMVMPKGCEVKIDPATAGGDGSVFDSLRGACNEEILVGILGQTMTTLDGSSRSQGEVHLEVQAAKHKADRRFVQRVLNKQLLPLLEKRGYPVSGGYFYFPDAGQSISLQDRITIDTEVAAVVPVSCKYFYETYGIAMPEEGEPLAGRRPATEPPEPDRPDPAEDDAREATETSVWMRMLDFFASALGRGAWHSGDRHTMTNSALDDDPVDSADGRLIKRVARGESQYFDAELFARISGDLLRAMHEGLASRKGLYNLGLDYKWQNPAVITAMENNLYRFSAGKNIAQVESLNELFRSSGSFDEFAGKAKAVTDKFNTAYATTEYITANAIASSTANYHSMVSDVELFPYWEYCTAGDDKVSPTHAALDGLILPANDKAWAKIYPPNRWRCRCYVVPRMKHEAQGVNRADMEQQVADYLGSSDYKSSVNQGFGSNRAVQAIVFDENQNYVKLLDTNKALGKMTPRDWGLESLEELVGRSTVARPQYSGSAEMWRADNPVIMSLDSRGHTISDKVFSTHTSGKYAKGDNDRVSLLSAMKDVIASPHEVWLNAETGKDMPNNRIYLKYYTQQAIAVAAKVVNGRLEIHSWFKLSPSSEARYRRGMLIKKATLNE